MHSFARIAVLAILLAAARAQIPVVSALAAHRPFGTGCYDLAQESLYALFLDASVAAPALTGQSLVLVPHASGYTATWGGGVYLAPSGAATILPPSDDGQVAIALSQAMPMPGGAVSTLWVHSNGVLATGSGIDGGVWNTPPNDFTPSASFRNAPDTAFWAWHDWNPAEPGSGRIKSEETTVAGERVLCVTWHDVENFPQGLPNRGTFQFQLGLASGRVVYVWVAVDGSVTSPFSTAHLVGYSPGGPSLHPLPIAVGVPRVTAPDVQALVLAASPPPVSTATNGTLVHYTTSHVPAVVAASDVRLGLLVLSLGATNGVDLGMVGAPGCRAYLQWPDVMVVMFGTSSSVSVGISFPAGLPAGLDVFAQSLALLPPRTWNAEDNTLGLVTSNGVQSSVAPH